MILSTFGWLRKVDSISIRIVQQQLNFNITVPKQNPIQERERMRERLRRTLAERAGLRVELVLTRNRVTMASVRFVSEGHVQARLHESFARAPEDVVSALVGYFRSRHKKYWDRVCAYARDIPSALPVHEMVCHTQGRVYDLAALAREVNRTYFDGKLHYRVGWGRRSAPARRRSIRYGSCNVETRLIRIHPSLDQEQVPVDFVRYILYHEMLHLVFPPVMRNGCRVDHPQIFRRWEQRFPNYQSHKELATRLLREMG